MKPVAFPEAVQLALDAVLNQRLAVLIGAGVSMAAPSRLPSAWNIAKRAKAKYLAQYGNSRPALSDNIEEQAEFFFKNGQLSTVYIPNLIDADAFASIPNDGHTALADLLLCGALTFGLTTNVDALIETAGTLLLGEVSVGVDGAAVAAAPAGTSALLKIHGCWRIDKANTVWAPSQVEHEPVKSRIDRSATWLAANILNRDLIIIGYSTDWAYLNATLDAALGASNPASVMVVDVATQAEFGEKAPGLMAVGERATNGFRFLNADGAEFLRALRIEYSKSFIRQALAAGTEAFTTKTGNEPAAHLLDPPTINVEQFWAMRRDLSGCKPDQPARLRVPYSEPLLGMFILQLRAAGAVPDGAFWSIGGRTVRVLRTPATMLNLAEAEFAHEVPPAAAADIVVAIGAEDFALPASIARSSTGTIARGSASQWITRQTAEIELGL